MGVGFFPLLTQCVGIVQDLQSLLWELILEQQECLKKLKTEHGEVLLGNITVDMVLGGMTGLLWETSLLDADEVYPRIFSSHPRTQFSTGVMALQVQSEFQKTYEKGGIHKSKYWEPTYEDSMNLIAMLSLVVVPVF